MRLRRFLVSSVLVISLLVAVTAQAAQPNSGKWTGKLNTNGAKVTFRVVPGGNRIRSFAVVLLPVYCYGSGLTHKVFLVPSVGVRNSGTFSRVYKTRNDSGQVDGSLELSGRFTTAKRAAGRLNYNRSGCSSGPVGWTARR